MSSRTRLIIPIEIAARELEAKLLLACLAVKRSFPVILGCRYDLDLQADLLPRGVRLEKGITDASFKMFRNLSELGFDLVAWDEEALVYHNDQVYQLSRLSARSMALTRRLMAWGEDNARLWRTWPEFAGTPISITGNVRADLLRPEFRQFHEDAASRLRQQYGPFILINSSFGSVNFHDPEERSTKFDRFVAQQGAMDFLEYRRALFAAMRAGVPCLAEAFPGHRIVIRPHPAESHDIWQEIAAAHENVNVVYSGSVAPWLLAAAATIHNGCTTAVESFLLGRPAIAFRPVVSNQWDIKLPNQLSHQAFDLAELLTVVEARLGGKLDDRPLLGLGSDVLKDYVAGQAGRYAGERILDAIETISAELKQAPLSGLRRWYRARKMRHRRLMKCIHAATSGGRSRKRLRQRNFPEISAPDIVRIAQRLRKANEVVPEIQAREIFPRIFEISARAGCG